GPSLLVPARPDSAPEESAPAPFLAPGRPSPSDSSTRTPAERGLEQYRLGRSLERSGQGGPAIVASRNALRFDPAMPDANYRMGMLFLTVNQLEEAAKCFAAELSRHPDHLDAAREMGLVLVRLGHADRGVQQLELVTRRHPRDSKGW